MTPLMPPVNNLLPSCTKSNSFNKGWIRFLICLPHTYICKSSGQFNLHTPCTQALPEANVVTRKAHVKYYVHVLKKVGHIGYGINPGKDPLQEVRQHKYRTRTSLALSEWCYHCPAARSTETHWAWWRFCSLRAPQSIFLPLNCPVLI